MSWGTAILFVLACITLVLEVTKWLTPTPNRRYQAHPLTRTERRRLRRRA